MNATYSIPESNVGRFCHKFDILARRAAKLGQELTRKEVGEEFKTFKVDGEERTFRYVQIEVVGETPRFQGWVFAATVDTTPEGNLVRRVPSELTLPEWVQTSGCKCDHCKTNRFRSETFLLHNVDTGDWKQIGRSCLKDFLGHADPHQMAAIAELSTVVGELAGSCEEVNDGMGGGCRSASYESTDTILRYSAVFIRKNGYIKSSEEGSTKNDVFNLLYPNYRYLSKKALDEVRSLRDEANSQEISDLVAKAREWAAGLTGTSEFDNNMRLIERLEYVNMKTVGLACYLVAGYLRSLGIQKEKASKLNEHFGTVGKRMKGLKLTVVRKFSMDGFYGVTHIHVMEDAEGRCFKWATGACSLQEGEEVTMDGSVKSHDDYKGRLQTVLTRCKVL